MITGVDTNVLIDVFRNDARFVAVSAAALRKSIQQGRIVVCDVVWAEVAACFPSENEFEKAVHALRVEFLPTTKEASAHAGRIWRMYRSKGGDRTRLVPDFLIAAHAQHQCDRLLTRDLGFYRRYFKELTIVDPNNA